MGGKDAALNLPPDNLRHGAGEAWRGAGASLAPLGTAEIFF